MRIKDRSKDTQRTVCEIVRLTHACVCVHVCVPLEPRGNDFTSSGQLGFLLVQTMSGRGPLNRGQRVDERGRVKTDVEVEERGGKNIGGK